MNIVSQPRYARAWKSLYSFRAKQQSGSTNTHVLFFENVRRPIAFELGQIGAELFGINSIWEMGDYGVVGYTKTEARCDVGCDSRRQPTRRRGKIPNQFRADFVRGHTFYARDSGQQ